jgi:hypothetical protein
MRIEKIDGKFIVDIAYSHAQGQTRRLTYDKVILCTGFCFDASVFDESCTPDLIYNGKLPAQTHEWESTTVPDLYFAGTLMQACDFKKTMSGFIHGFRYNIKALSNILEMKYHNVPWPNQTVDAYPAVVLDKVFERLNNGSGIFLQPGFMCDVVIIDELSGKAHYYEDMRADYVANSLLRESPHYYVISLEYGHYMGGDPFSIERDPDPEKGGTAFYLHPIIRRFHYGELVAEHHVQDDVENEWCLEEYMRPARVFFNAHLSNFREVHPAMT